MRCRVRRLKTACRKITYKNECQLLQSLFGAYSLELKIMHKKLQEIGLISDFL